VGFTTFPGERFRAPRSWVELSYPDLTYFHDVDKGGHFGAWEEPELFASELRSFRDSLRSPSADNGAPRGRGGIDGLYDRAKAEQELALSIGGPTAPWQACADAFQSAYPGIQVTIEGGFSNVLTPEIDSQIAKGKLQVDAAILQTLQDFARWKTERKLLRYMPEGWETIDETFKDLEGDWVGITVNVIAYTYNTELLQPADVPESALDFLKPRFRGKAVTPYPADDDVTLYRFHTIVERYGWEFMDRYMANEPNFIQGHLGALRSISGGENLVTFDMIAALTLAEKAEGHPAELAFPSEDPMPIWAQGAAIFRDAPHPNAAKLFLTWFLAKEQQEKFVGWSVRTDVAPPATLKPIFDYHVANNYAEFVSDEKRLAELRKRFESYTGPVKNVGGVR
jgi:ABC-type Fe3+ transport system substrate-binding protein